MLKIQVTGLLFLFVTLFSTEAIPASSYLRWLDWVDEDSVSTDVIGDDEEHFKDKAGNKCTLTGPMGDKPEDPDEDKTIEIKCGEEDSCSYTGKPFQCKNFAKNQKNQKKFYRCVVKGLKKVKGKVCDVPSLECKKICKALKFEKAEQEGEPNYYILY